jgi:hypothetical protein
VVIIILKRFEYPKGQGNDEIREEGEEEMKYL